MTYRTRIVIFAVMASALAACGGDDDDATAEATATTEAAPTTTAPADTTIPVTDAAPTTAPPADATPPTEGGGVSPGDTVEGDIELGQFPTPISFTTSDRWLVPVAEPEGVALEDPVQEAPFTRAVLFLIATPTGGHQTIGDRVGSEDLSGLGLQYDEVTIVDQAATQVGGFDATVYDLTYDGSGELPLLRTQGFGGSIILRDTEYYRIWEVDNGEDFVVFAPVLRGDLEWLDKAEALIDTIEFGEK